MSKVKSPQEKKRLSYSRDRRNCYGECPRSSRKNISRNKRRNSRLFRRSSVKLSTISSHSLDEDYLTGIEADVKSSERLRVVRRFRKVADQPLGEYVQNLRDLKRRK